MSQYLYPNRCFNNLFDARSIVKFEGIDYVIASRESSDTFGFGIDNPT